MFKLVLETAQMSAALATLKRTVEKRTTIPILSHILVAAEPHGPVTMTATDLDQTVTVALDGDVIEAGAAALPAHALADLVKGLDKGSQIAIQTEENAANAKESPPAVICSGLIKMTLNAGRVSDFPIMAPDKSQCAFLIGAHVLRRAMAQTSFAISTEETRYYLNGVFVHYAEKEAELRFVAMDGHRLAVAKINPPVGAHALPPVIIPRKAIAELEKMLAKSKADQPVGVKVRACVLPGGTPTTLVEFSYDRTVLLTKHIDGTFPDYDRAIPRDNRRRLAFEPVAVAAIVKRVSTMSSERGRTVALDFDGGLLDVSVSNPDRGTIKERAPSGSTMFDGEPLRIGFNATYLLDVLARLGDGSAVAHFDDAGSPTIFRRTESSAEFFVLMPCRV